MSYLPSVDSLKTAGTDSLNFFKQIGIDAWEIKDVTQREQIGKLTAIAARVIGLLGCAYALYMPVKMLGASLVLAPAILSGCVGIFLIAHAAITFGITLSKFEPSDLTDKVFFENVLLWKICATFVDSIREQRF